MSYEEVTNLALRRGFYFPTSEIYANSPSGFWEFGPIGERFRQNIISIWRKYFVRVENFEEISGSQILSKRVFESSGHLKSFNDPIIQCKKCHSLFRADKLIEEKIGGNIPESLELKEFDELIKKNNVVCPKCKCGEFEPVRNFNMMIKTDIGATGEIEAYLRPETCQNIFLDFQRVYKISRRKLPLGIAQVGSAFRNEIAPRNGLIREREIRQMEVEVFFNPNMINDIEGWENVKNYKLNLLLPEKEEILKISCEDAVEKKIVSGKLIAYYLAKVQQLYSLKYGFSMEKMRFRGLNDDERAFYAKETWDFEVKTSLGWVELIANNYRGSYDLEGHSKGSNNKLMISEDGEKFIPHVFEISAGVDRTIFSILDNSYRKEKRGENERIYLKLPVETAPYKLAVFPLVKKDGISDIGRKIAEQMRDKGIETVYDEKGSIGRRYARVDEIGVPYVLTVDYQTKEDGTLTLRNRDSMEQSRVKLEDVLNIFRRG